MQSDIPSNSKPPPEFALIAVIEIESNKRNSEDLNDAIQTLEPSSNRTVLPEDINHNVAHLSLCDADKFREDYKREGDISRLDKAIAIYTRLLKTIEDNLVSQRVLRNLADTLIRRYSGLGAGTDLDDAHRAARHALVHSFPEDPDYTSVLLTAAEAMYFQGIRSGATYLLEEALLYVQQALPLAPLTLSCEFLPLLTNLTLVLRRAGSSLAKNMDYVTGRLREAIDSVDTEDSVRPVLLNSLGALAREESTDVNGDLAYNYAIELFYAAVESAHPSHPSLPTLLHNLGTTLSLRYRRRGAVNDIREARKALEQSLAVSAIMPGPRRIFGLASLSAVLQDHFRAMGHIDDLNKAISAARQAVVLSRSRNLLHSASMNSLAAALGERYYQTGDCQDLEDAIGTLRSLVDMHLPETQDAITALHNLAHYLFLRYDLRRNVNDASEAVALLEKVLAMTVPGQYAHYNGLCNLAENLRLQGETEVSEELLDRALSVWQRARDTCHKGAASVRYYSTVGSAIAHSRRFLLAGKAQDFDCADEFFRETLQLLPVGHARRAECLFEYARLLLCNATQGYTLAGRGFRLLAEAVAYPHTSAVHRMLTAVDILPFCHPAVTGRPELALDAFSVYADTLGLLPRIGMISPSIHARLRSPARTERMSLSGALLMCSLALPQKALELLELGRASFWTQAFRLRTPLDNLPDEVRRELSSLACALQTDGFEASVSPDDPSGSAILDEHRARRLCDSEKFNTLIEDIRCLPGYQDFMSSAVFDSLIGAALDGPVIILIDGTPSAYALVLKPSREAMAIPLGEMHDTWLAESCGSWRTMARDSHGSDDDRLGLTKKHSAGKAAALNLVREQERILSVLWNKICRPIINTLGYQHAKSRDRPRLWWIPTGKFVFLPIHAAGTKEESCSDYIVSSYAPSAAALIHARKGLLPVSRDAIKAVLVAVAEPGRGFSSLPCVAEEVQQIQSTWKENNISMEDLNDGEVDYVLSKLSTANILHLACHGQQDAENPLESGFVMRDGKLSISRLMGLSLPDARFAFLSACETARGDKAQPDQIVHLAAAMLFVGFRSVVGTLWSMQDADGPVVSKTVYQQLFPRQEGSGELDLSTIPYALDHAVQQLRSSGLPPIRWATYVHYGV